MPATAAPARCCSTARQVCACLVPLAQAAGRAVTTVEGLAAPTARSPRCSSAFLAHGAAQCGICTPGMLMAASDAARRRRRGRTQAQVEDALGGVLCRCTGYRKIVDAVCDAHRFADAPAVLPPAAGDAVGARMPRLDGAAEGRRHASCFGADAAPADALWLRRGPLAARRARASASATWRRCCARHPGLRAGADGGRRAGRTASASIPDFKDQPVLRRRPGALPRRGGLALVGDARRRSLRSATELPDRLEAAAAARRHRRGAGRGRAAAARRWPDNVLIRGRRGARRRRRRRWPGARMSPTGEFETGFVEHAYIEPEAGCARRVGDRDRGLRLHPDALHGPRRGRAACSASPPRRVRIVPVGLRRRLRRQARPLGAAAAGGRRLDARPAGARWSTPRPRVDGRHAPSATRRACRARSAATPRAG